MIRSVLSAARVSSLFTLSSASSFVRPLSLSPCLRDGIFPDYPKQGIDHRQQVPLRQLDSQQPALSPPTNFAQSQLESPISSSSPPKSLPSPTTPFSLPPSSRTPSTSSSSHPSSLPNSPGPKPTYSSPPSSNPSDLSASSRIPAIRPKSPVRRNPRKTQLESPISEISAQSDFIFDPDRSLSARQSLLPSQPTRRRLQMHLYIKRSNIIATLNWASVDVQTGPNPGQSIIKRGSYSGGSMGFRGANEGTNEAGYQVVMACFKRAMEENEVALEHRRASSTNQTLVGYDSQAEIGIEVHVFLNGFGQGREAFFDALRSAEGESMRQLITQLSDASPLPRGHQRGKSIRRI